MNKAIIGRKLGMSQYFTPEGIAIPVTVVEAGPCPVVQVKTVEKDGYKAVQLGFGGIKEKNVNKPMQGALKKFGFRECGVIHLERGAERIAFDCRKEWF